MRPLISNPDEYNDPPRPFFEHIVALRACLMNAAIAWVACCIVAGVFAPQVLDWLKSPAQVLEKAGKLTIEGLDLTSGFSTIMSIAMWGGTALSFPFLMYFILRFIFPALTKREKAAILFYLMAGSFCFGVGVWFSYSKITPQAVAFFDLVNRWVHLPVTVVRIEGYISIVLKLIIAFGLVFQIPLILFVLGWLGLISSDTLRRFRKFAIVIAFFLGMALTPPDPMSQIMMALPLCLFYEMSVWGVWLKEKLDFTASSEKKDDPPPAADAPATEAPAAADASAAGAPPAGDTPGEAGEGGEGA